jgi:hypothetical protein
MTLIMISAMYENGGNTTHRMLDGHPELLVYPFESQVGTPLVSDYLTSYVPIRYRWPEFAMSGEPGRDYELFWDEELKTYLRVRSRSKFRDCGLEMDEQDRRREFVAYLRDRPRSGRAIVEAYFHSTFASWKNLRRSGSERAWVGYNPVQVLDVDKFFRDFPDGHMIHTVRHPFAGYADTKKRPFPLGLERYGWTWNLCQHTALVAEQRYAGRFHVLRFEDLVADPKASLGLLLERMGFEWSDACAAPSFNGQRLSDIQPWGTIRKPTTEAHDATKRELLQQEQDQLSALTRVMFDMMYEGRAERAGVADPVVA